MNTILNLYIDFACKKEVLRNSFIVGGTVRDILTDKKIHDYDVTVKGEVENIARAFAGEISGSFVILDKNFGIMRVAKGGEFIDICSMKGKSIEDDLSVRDFTINAMAVNLDKYEKFLDKKQIDFIIDPFNGLKDLNYGIIRMVSENNLSDDPLRLLRAYRFASTLGFSIDGSTHASICKLASYMSNVAVERIAEELRLILRVKFSYKTIREMQKSGLLLSIFPELKQISTETLHHSIRTYAYLEHILDNLSLYFKEHTALIVNYFAAGYRIICLKLAVLLRAGFVSKEAALRLRMSRKEIEFIHTIERLYENIMALKSADKKHKIGFLRMCKDDLYSLIIFGISDELICRPTENPMLLFFNELLEIYHREILPRTKLLPILTGDDLIREFHLKPSPLFKELLYDIEGFFLEGRINSRQEAVIKVMEMLKTKRLDKV